MRKSDYPEKADTLGKRIRKRRMDLKLTLLEVAKSAGVTESYVSRIEADKQVPELPVVIKIALFLKDNAELYIRTAIEKSQQIIYFEKALKHLKTPSPLKESIKDLLKNVKSHPELPIKYATRHEKKLTKDNPEFLNWSSADLKKDLKKNPPPK